MNYCAPFADVVRCGECGVCSCAVGADYDAFGARENQTGLGVSGENEPQPQHCGYVGPTSLSLWASIDSRSCVCMCVCVCACVCVCVCASEAINFAAEAWGIRCLRYEIRDIQLPTKVKEAMQMQVR